MISKLLNRVNHEFIVVQMSTQLKRALRALRAAGALGRGVPQGAQHQAHVFPLVPAQDTVQELCLTQ